MKWQIEEQIKNDRVEELAKALASLDTSEKTLAFLRDVLTLEEITEAANRLRAAKLLKEGWKIRQIAAELKISTATVVRINYWLHHGMGGYELALDKLE
jgi:TrpR-related protein YerC/YecD